MVVLAKRVYASASPADGRRYLVDRLWPRGVSRESLELAGWLKEIAPTAELRTWFAHDPKRYPEFRERYRAELRFHGDLVRPLVEEARAGTVTLLFAATDPDHCNATVLREWIEERLRAQGVP
jgi:uncharacterized protein YeaO (DUF488 family)